MENRQQARAAVCREFGADLSIENVYIDPPKENAVQVKISACAICHSDVAAANGAWGGALPALYGHEAAGHVSAVGEGAPFAVGDRVLVTLIRACGDCPACSDQDPTSCDHAWDDFGTPIHDASGAAVRQGMATGAFADYVTVDASQVVALPDDLPMEISSLLACGVITGVGAVKNTAKLRKGQSAVIIGAGGVGLNAIQGAALLGASPIIAVDVTEAKLETAREFGATHGVLVGEDMVANVREITNGRGADYVFVTVGAPSAFAGAPNLLAPNGSVVMIGMPPSGTAVDYDPTTLAAMNQKLLGSRMGQTNIKIDIPWLIEEYRAGRLLLDNLVSETFPLERINEAIAKTKAGGANRNVIVFD